MLQKVNKITAKYSTILFDFDGVLSQDRFYRLLKDLHPNVWNFVQTKLFSKENKHMIDRWMRGEVNAEFINDFISRNLGIRSDYLNEILVDGAKNFTIDPSLLPLIDEFKKNNRRVLLVTDNMDVFDRYVSPSLVLEDIFDYIFSSSKHGLLKSEGLFDHALNTICVDYSDAFLVDNSPGSVNYFQAKGGGAFLYTSFADFDKWVRKQS